LYRINTFGAYLNEVEFVLDLRFRGYTPGEVRHYFELIGNKGLVQFQQIFTLGYDIVYPIAYSVFFSLAISKLFPGSWLNLVPLLVFAVDMVENICLYQLIQLYPNATPQVFDAQVQLANSFTLIKWALAIASVLLVLAGLLQKLFFNAKEKKQE